MRQISDAGIAKIKQWEGLRTTAYRDGGGVLTIGYGHTSDMFFQVKPGAQITEAKADELLRIDLREAEQAVDAAVDVPLTDGQFAALVSFVFNVGVDAFKKSTLLRKLNAGNYDAVPGELARWNKDNGKVVSGLTRRRTAEAALWNSGAFVSSASVAASPKPSIIQMAAKPEIILATIGAAGSATTAASGTGPFAWVFSAVVLIGAVTAAIWFIRKESRE